MKIVSWNVAGFAPFASQAAYHYGSVSALFKSLGADIICLQETKTQADKLSADNAVVEGYESFWACAQAQKGYSGVATFVRDGPFSPIAADDRPFGDPAFDDEGRVLVTDHGAFQVWNVYVPNAGSDEAGGRPRLQYKLSFLRALKDKLIAAWRVGKHVILVGDMNIAHGEADVFPKVAAKDPQWHGYSEDEIAWMDDLILRAYSDGSDGVGGKHDSSSSSAVQSESSSQKFDKAPSQQLRLVNAWRAQYPSQRRFTVWDWRTEARVRNEGVRIDYILPDAAFYAKYVHPHQQPQQRQHSSTAAVNSSSSSLSAAHSSSPATDADNNSSTVEPVLDLSAAGALTQCGVAAIINTPTRWSDHAAILLTSVDPPLPRYPHPPAPLSSRVHKRYQRPGADLRTMFAAAAAASSANKKKEAPRSEAHAGSSVAAAVSDTAQVTVPTLEANEPSSFTDNQGSNSDGATAAAEAALKSSSSKPKGGPLDRMFITTQQPSQAASGANAALAASSTSSNRSTTEDATDDQSAPAAKRRRML